ncbi:hypothetical protein GOBAR_AA26730 [Gossypium barbadense]|uniref:Uncharacterized protein n=1 Tax=Gossypium barbadense TaxID=3634 RepID=A0A2P5WS74_GOSBA|nr:hypothetical protein GOBAR_AA26730 [Gossypium barbadense]
MSRREEEGDGGGESGRGGEGKEGKMERKEREKEWMDWERKGRGKEEKRRRRPVWRRSRRNRGRSGAAQGSRSTGHGQAAGGAEIVSQRISLAPHPQGSPPRHRLVNNVHLNCAPRSLIDIPTRPSIVSRVVDFANNFRAESGLRIEQVVTRLTVGYSYPTLPIRNWRGSRPTHFGTAFLSVTLAYGIRVSSGRHRLQGRRARQESTAVTTLLSSLSPYKQKKRERMIRCRYPSSPLPSLNRRGRTHYHKHKGYVATASGLVRNLKPETYQAGYTSLRATTTMTRISHIDSPSRHVAVAFSFRNSLEKPVPPSCHTCTISFCIPVIQPAVIVREGGNSVFKAGPLLQKRMAPKAINFLLQEDNATLPSYGVSVSFDARLSVSKDSK